MSIDLKALRYYGESARHKGHDSVGFSPADVLALLDRLEFAERMRNEAEKDLGEQSLLLIQAYGDLDSAERERDELRKDAERYRWLEKRARRDGRDDGWTGIYELYPVRAWDDTPYSAERGEGFHYHTLADAIDAAMSKERGEA